MVRGRGMNRGALGLKREDTVSSAKMGKWAPSANLGNDTERKVFQTGVFKREARAKLLGSVEWL